MYRKIEETPARKIFSHLDTYNRYEKGIREIPLDSLMLLAKTYDCSLDYLAGISDQPRKYGNNARNRTVSEKYGYRQPEREKRLSHE